MAPRRYIFGSLLLTVLTVCGIFARTGAPNHPHPGDPQLENYFQHCRMRVNDPGGLALCDTLYQRAVAAGDKRMQVQALCLRLERFYYLNDEARIIEGVRRVQDFCDENSDADLRYYYYFVWSGRLIAYYIKQGKTNVAVYETHKMLDKAKQEHYLRGIAAGHQMLANVYFSEGSYRLAYENFHRQAAVLERESVDDINLPTIYGVMAECALKLNMPDSAIVALDKADRQFCKTPYQRFTLNNAHALYSIYCKDFATAERYVDANRELVRVNSSLIPHRALLNELETEFYQAQGAYRQALETLAKRERDSLRGGDVEEYRIPKLAGDISWQMGDMRRAAESYREYIRRADSVRSEEVRSATDDFSELLEIERLRSETQELRYDVQNRRLHSTYMILCSLGGLLLLGGVSLVRTKRLNHRLKNSETKIRRQNEELVVTGEELRVAMRNAEEVSRMKTEFIQNMSHEVRTPLNSIVGFSQVLASQYRHNRDTCEYAEIIERSSVNLLRLIDDVLDIASLDRMELLPMEDRCELNNCCHECADKLLQDVKPGVAMVFESSYDNPVVRVNTKRIQQVLMHLLHNAAKFTDQGEIILNYTFLRDEKRLRFTVSDTGPGIPVDQHEHVFERFVKLDSFSQGTGLGLSICRVVSAKLGGTLRVDPAYTRGCRMVFEVPFKEVETVA